MRTPRFAFVPLFAGLVVSAVAAACKDREPTAASSSPRVLAAQQSSAGGSMAGVTIPPVGGFSSEVLSRSRFADDVDILFRIKMGHTMAVQVDGSAGDVVMAKVTIQQGGALPWHTHPGPAIVSVRTGELTIVRADGCTVHRYPAGSALIDPGHGMVHAAFNSAASGATVLDVTYLDVPHGQSPLVPVPNPGC
ncbi:MAG TPA: cupin domain-containing protein [Gemmatimonadaceae bacterium]|nr:cupin domain-containing protein [Gemmatimonadaceae bacterium]